MANRIKFNKSARDRFLESLRETANVREACKAAGVGRRTAYDHRDADPEFAAAWKEAEEIATDALEAEARRRAIYGVAEPVFHKGAICGHIVKYSDRMLEILLKAHRPGKFRENVSMEHSGPGGTPIEVTVSFVTPKSEVG